MLLQQCRNRRLLMKRQWPVVSVLLLSLMLGSIWILSGCVAPDAQPETWAAQPVANLPATIEPEDERWHEADPFVLPLHAGSHGELTAQSVELRALYDESAIAFRARWPGTANAQTNERFALIWHKDDLPDQRGQDCTTACHVARSNSQGDIQAVVPSFIPAGREEPLSAQAVWHDGMWTMSWYRLLDSPEARDIQYNDLSQRYRVRAKVFLDLHQKPDLLTEDTYLTFARHAK